MERSGKLIRVYGAPVSDMIPKGFQYFPLKVAVDKTQRLYVIAQGAYEGIMEFDAKGSFRGTSARTRSGSVPSICSGNAFPPGSKAAKCSCSCRSNSPTWIWTTKDLFMPSLRKSMRQIRLNGLTRAERTSCGGKDISIRSGTFPPSRWTRPSKKRSKTPQLDVHRRHIRRERHVQRFGFKTQPDIHVRRRRQHAVPVRRRRHERKPAPKPTALAMLGDRVAVLDAGMSQTPFCPYPLRIADPGRGEGPF